MSLLSPRPRGGALAAILALLVAAPLDGARAETAGGALGGVASQAAEARGVEDPNLVWTPAATVLTRRELAPGVFAVVPDDAEAKNAAGVPVATSGGFVVGEDGVMVIDTMINRPLAEQLLALVRETTPAPILYALNTSYHGDHSYGNQFLPDGVRIVQHRETQAYIERAFAQDVAFMSQHFGTASGLDELEPQGADIVLDDGVDRTFDLGGKTVRVRHHGFAQSDGDLFVHLPEDGALFTGNPVISAGPSLPWLLDGNAAEALETLRRVRTTYPEDTVIVPGHGAPTDMEAVDAHIAYLDELLREVGAAKAEGLSLEETSARVSERMREAHGGYALYPWVHSQLNVGQAYEEAPAP